MLGFKDEMGWMGRRIDMRRMIFAAIGLVVLTTGCQTTNQQYGAVGGAVAGGLLGNTIGKGKGNTIATAVGAVLGTIAGSEVGRSMDQPRTIVHTNNTPAQPNYGVCSGITNEGALSSCKKGVATRLREEQRRLERDAYKRGYGR
jgi:hypothetical protein